MQIADKANAKKRGFRNQSAVRKHSPEPPDLFQKQVCKRHVCMMSSQGWHRDLAVAQNPIFDCLLPVV
jgi:hypothetical protein